MILSVHDFYTVARKHDSSGPGEFINGAYLVFSTLYKLDIVRVCHHDV